MRIWRRVAPRWERVINSSRTRLRSKDEEDEEEDGRGSR